MKPLAIGDSNFKEIVQNGYYIDKTAFIKEIIDNFFGTKLFLRPRRFGKTTNMYMLKEYFDISKKEENMDLFNDLYIDTLGEEYKKHQGAYPVIFMSLKKAKQDTWELMYDNLKKVVVKAYSEHKVVREVLDDFEIEKYNLIMQEKAQITDYQNSLQNLIEYLYRYYNKKIIVLIDEYDAPLNQAYINGFEKESIGFIRTFLSEALKDNHYVQVGIITGVLQIGQQSIFSDLNNFKSYTMYTNQASEHFGFTIQEVKQMLKDFEMEDKYEDIVKWYDGYNFGVIDIFNPWSILNCVDRKGETTIYWVNTGNTDLLTISTQGISAEKIDVIERLVKGECVDIEFEEKSTYETLRGNLKAFMNMLVYTGYLTVEEKYQVDGTDFAKVRVPNIEIREVFKKIRANWVKTPERRITLERIAKAIEEQDIEQFEKCMNKLLEQETSYFNSHEDFFKGLFISAMMLLPEEYVCNTETESGYGRLDYEIYKKDLSVGMIFEFKAAKTFQKLVDAAQIGMKQIEQNEYYTEMQKRGVKEIWLYSLAFSKKKMIIRRKLLEM